MRILPCDCRKEDRKLVSGGKMVAHKVREKPAGWGYEGVIWECVANFHWCWVKKHVIAECPHDKYLVDARVRPIWKRSHKRKRKT